MCAPVLDQYEWPNIDKSRKCAAPLEIDPGQTAAGFGIQLQLLNDIRENFVRHDTWHVVGLLQVEEELAQILRRPNALAFAIVAAQSNKNSLIEVAIMHGRTPAKNGRKKCLAYR